MSATAAIVAAILGAAASAQRPTTVPVFDEPVRERPHVEPPLLPLIAPRLTAAQLPGALGGWNAGAGDSPLGVFDAASCTLGGWVFVSGGYSDELLTIPVIQALHPRGGWLPIGSQLRVPRAQHAMVPFAAGEVLVIGGVAGRLGETTPLASVELLDPRVAGSAREIDPLPRPVARPRAFVLPGGRVVVAGGDAVFELDRDRLRWRIVAENFGSGVATAAASPSTNVETPEDAATAAPLIAAAEDEELPLAGLGLPPHEDGGIAISGRERLLLVGGGCDAIDEIDLSAKRTTVRRWEARLDCERRRCGAVALRDGRVLLIGGIDPQTGCTLSTTLVLNPATRRVQAGPDLALDRGICDPVIATLADRVVILGGEWRSRSARGEVAGARLLTPEPDGARAWTLPDVPEPASRRQCVRLPDGTVLLQGGYAFVAPDRAAAEGREPGASVLSSTHAAWAAVFDAGD